MRGVVFAERGLGASSVYGLSAEPSSANQHGWFLAPAGQATTTTEATPMIEGSESPRPKAPVDPRTPYIRLAGETLATAGTTIASIINSNNATEQERLRQEAAVKIAELQATAGAQQSPIVQQQIDALRAVMAQLTGQQQQGISTNTAIALGIGALVVVGALLFFTMRGPRTNPVVSHGRAVSHDEVGGDKVFVRASKLRKKRRKKSHR